MQKNKGQSFFFLTKEHVFPRSVDQLGCRRETQHLVQSTSHQLNSHIIWLEQRQQHLTG